MPLTLAEKIAEACRAIPDLEKLGDNGEYTYLRAHDVFKAIRGELFKRGIVVIPEEILSVDRSQPYLAVNDNIIDEVRVRVKYKISDGVEVIYGEGVGVGQDYMGKALYMALTGSLKFFIQAIGLIAGIPDDPETVNEARVPDGLAEKLDEAEKKFGTDLREHPISRRDTSAFNSAVKQSGWGAKAVKATLAEFGVEKISDLKRKDFSRALAWAMKKDDESSGMDSRTK